MQDDGVSLPFVLRLGPRAYFLVGELVILKKLRQRYALLDQGLCPRVLAHVFEQERPSVSGAASA